MNNMREVAQRTDGSSIYELRKGEPENFRCFGCLTWYSEIPDECLNCGCSEFTPKEKVELEDRLFDESAHFTSELGELKREAVNKIAKSQTRRIAELSTEVSE